MLITQEYRRFVEELKARVAAARLSAARAVNRDLIPQAKGFSPRNLRKMKQVYVAYSEPSIWPQAVAKLGMAKSLAIWPQPAAKLSARKVADILRQFVAEVPWGHNLIVLEKSTDPAARLYYLRATARFGWSRNVLLNQVKAGAYERAVTEAKSHNFPLAMTEHLAEQADEMLKSSYNLEFLGIRHAVKERELEDRLISRLQAFLLEPGYGFCFVGRQHRLTLGEKESRTRGQDGFLPESAQRQGTHAGRSPINWRHFVRGKGRHRSGIRPACQEQSYWRRGL